MKKLSLITLILIGFSLQAQIPLVATLSDCNGTTKSIQSVLGTGKAIIISSKGVDCSSCGNASPGYESWGAQNSAKVEVWAAMTYRFNPNNFSNPCAAIASWENQYNWSTVFAFDDANRDWVGPAMPRYYVYSPQDSSIIYNGPSFTTARNQALAASTVGIKENLNDLGIEMNRTTSQLILNDIPENFNQVSLYDLKGSRISFARVANKQVRLSIDNLSNGVYFIQVNGQTSIIEKIYLP